MTRGRIQVGLFYLVVVATTLSDGEFPHPWLFLAVVAVLMTGVALVVERIRNEQLTAAGFPRARAGVSLGSPMPADGARETRLRDSIILVIAVAVAVALRIQLDPVWGVAAIGVLSLVGVLAFCDWSPLRRRQR